VSEILPKRKGLPVRVKMRHEAHFVEELVARHEVAVGKMVPLSAIEPNPDQPRKEFGDLGDLVESIRSKGVLEPLLVRRKADGADGKLYRIVAGERRYRASVLAGLFEVPIIELDISDEEALEIALIENLQRKDLTPFEEAEGYQNLATTFDYTHERLAEVVGKSRTTITETLGILSIPAELRAKLPPGLSRSVLLELARAKSPAALASLVDNLRDGQPANRDDIRQARKQAASPRTADRRKPYVFKFRSPDKSYSLALQFRQSTVDRADLIRALEAILGDLRDASNE
jgi:ParB family chromosome partitioning protein